MRLYEWAFSHPAPLREVLRRIIGRLKLGSYEFRLRIGALPRPNYAYIMYEAARLAQKLGVARISVIEFGVAGGNGLVAMERHAEAIERLFDLKIEIYGFDTGGGLPEPGDYRDLPYHWQAGFFSMDRDALMRKLSRARLILGDVADTWEKFLRRDDPAPIAAVSHDFDFYSSTMAGLKLFEAAAHRLMPRVFCYFDDTIGSEEELYSQFSGQRLAIEDFNRSGSKRRIGIPYYLRIKQALGIWVNQIWILHVIDHEKYNTFIGEKDQSLPLLEAD